MYFGVMFAVVTSGTIVQTGPDEIVTTAYGKVSCNPCWSRAYEICGTVAACDLSKPWDPFNDPEANCGGSAWNPFFNVGHRVPIDPPCTPEE
jgi:hypothetical protein